MFVEFPFPRRRLSLVPHLLIAFLFFIPASGQEPDVTKWSDAQGREIEAEFVRLEEGLEEDEVVLRLRRDGREVKVPLVSLSLDSHFQAIKLGNPAAFSKPVPKAEVKPESPEVSIAPPEFTLEESLRSPFGPGTTLEKYLEILKQKQQLANGFVAWHALPPKMQADIEDVIIKAVEVLQPSTLKQIQVLMSDLDTIARDKKDFVLNSSRLAMPPEVAQGLEADWPLISGLAAVLADPQHWSQDNFSKGSVAKWLARLDYGLAPYVVAGRQTMEKNMPQAAEMLQLGDYQILSQSADKAEVEFSRGGEATKKSLQKLGIIWIDPEQMKSMREGLDTAKEKLASGAGTEMQMVRLSLGGVIAAVSSLARATTQQEFDEAVGLLQSISGDMAKTARSAGLLPAGPEAGGGGRPGGGRPGQGGRPRSGG